ncbi:hypothetical protein DO73_4235 [Burkholderia pseudomallei]|nr:hypothetical protein DO73_4235 [Burkholderia pseudomallei]
MVIRLSSRFFIEAQQRDASREARGGERERDAAGGTARACGKTVGKAARAARAARRHPTTGAAARMSAAETIRTGASPSSVASCDAGCASSPIVCLSSSAKNASRAAANTPLRRHADWITQLRCDSDSPAKQPTSAKSFSVLRTTSPTVSVTDWAFRRKPPLRPRTVSIQPSSPSCCTTFIKWFFEMP